MIDVHLYGKLRKLVQGSRASENTVLKVKYEDGETFATLIKRLGLRKEDLADCFINGKLAKDSSKIHDGDRVGLFPFNMPLLCGGQHLKGHGFTQHDVDVDYY
jgi:molybdopterin converting factor small subunit